MLKRSHALALTAVLGAGLALAAVPVVRQLGLPAATPAAASATPAAPAAQRSTALPPRIEVLEVEPARALAPGAQLSFRLLGSAGGQAVLWLPDAGATLLLKEISPGHYRGVYLVGMGDNLRANSAVSAELTVDGRSDSATLDAPLLKTAAHQATGQRRQPARP